MLREAIISLVTITKKAFTTSSNFTKLLQMTQKNIRSELKMALKLDLKLISVKHAQS